MSIYSLFIYVNTFFYIIHFFYSLYIFYKNTILYVTTYNILKVYHCHILEHEDNDMMRPLKVINNSVPVE
ncbi:multicopper oxidase domain-containing protein [Clostridium neonatale]